jgi:putative SOS response-associated peptidase YedK
MCNEFAQEQSLDELLRQFRQLELPLGWEGGAPNMEPKASIRPTDPAYIVTGADGAGRLAQMRWGFPGPRGPVINFRSDERSFPKGRCLVPISAFYEFTGAKAPKSKWRFSAADDSSLLGVAGLIREDRFTLLTCPPGADIAPYHDRQIVILPPQHWAQWLDTRQPAPPIAPAPPGTLKVVQVR